jgi:hypothetical protein
MDPNMAAARFAAVVFALASVGLPAQPAGHGQLTIQVIDPTGAVIPGARIEIDGAPASPQFSAIADSQGQAAVDLATGTYGLLITSQGFMSLARRVEVSETAQTVVARLKTANGTLFGFGELDPGRPLDIDLIRPPELVFLSPLPIGNFAPLPLRPAKKHWH